MERIAIPAILDAVSWYSEGLFVLYATDQCPDWHHLYSYCHFHAKSYFYCYRAWPNNKILIPNKQLFKPFI